MLIRPAQQPNNVPTNPLPTPAGDPTRVLVQKLDVSVRMTHERHAQVIETLLHSGVRRGSNSSSDGSSGDILGVECSEEGVVFVADCILVFVRRLGFSKLFSC